MRRFVTIAANAFMELIRQPIFLLLLSASALFIAFLSSISYFGFGDEPKLVKDSVLAVMLLTGLLASVLSASNSVAREIHTGTALAVLSFLPVLTLRTTLLFKLEMSTVESLTAISPLKVCVAGV